MSKPLSVGDLKGVTVGVCVSGGLDSKTVCSALKEGGVNVVSFSADLGQPDEDDIRNVRSRMATCGVDCTIVDAKDRVAELAFEVIMSLARYDGGYWNTTPIGRIATVQCLIPAMKRAGCSVLSHGATGRGNDQFRFERYTNVVDPSFRVYAPWRDPVLLERFPGRKEMADYLATKGIQAFVGPRKKYSTDANLTGLSHEAEDLEQLTTSMYVVQPEMSRWPQDAAPEPVDVTLRVEEGCVVGINGERVSKVDALRAANRIGSAAGLGITHALENRMLGTKSRGVYEAPGMELLGRAVEYIWQGTLERRALQLHRQMSGFISDQFYDGRYFDPATQAALAAVKHLAKHCTGTVTMRLYRGTVGFVSQVEMPFGLYFEDDASMEATEGRDALNPISSQGHAEVQAIAARRLAQVGQIKLAEDAGKVIE
eukprot:TRINITY_DN21345_c0_g1_i1.p1 TRINITY_DN21345_c0_g1~~TRINITY_DN21345_c0_g1_i1.p1  ORF type:complete len:427 (-),score=98.55 TRINITY_DN21345_c0_g1_i1:229-1509(-)